MLGTDGTPNRDAVRLGRVIRERRGALDMTQPELAERAGVSPAYIYMLEVGGLLHPGLESLLQVARAIDQAAPGVLRQAAATAARQAVQLAQLDQDPVVVEALAAAEAGQARRVDDHSPLGWCIRTWEAETRIVGRVRNDPFASLDAQRREARLLPAAGRAVVQPLKDPSPWLGHSGSALLPRWRAGQAVRAALFADPRTALYATLEQLRYLPGDPWMVVRAAALGGLRPGSVAGPPGATDR